MKRLLTILTITTIAGVVFTLTIYAVIGGNPFNRIGYAVFISTLPSLITFAVFKIGKLTVTRQRVAAIYTLLFVVVVILQGVLRTI